MRLRLLPPYGDSTWREIPLEAAVSVPDFLRLMGETVPAMRRYLRESAEETFHQMLLLRGDHVLAETEFISPTDSIVVVMPMTGG